MTSPRTSASAVEIEFPFHASQRERFRSGALADEWLVRYRAIFDEMDLKVAKSQPEHHFFEWLTAVLLFESTGYLSLIEKYTASNHPTKQERFKSIAGEEVFRDAMANQSGLPDLFVYAQDGSDWFFAEVKGASDRQRDHQGKRFLQLEVLCGRPVRLVRLKMLAMNGTVRVPGN